MYLYEVRLEQGLSKTDAGRFYEVMSGLGAKHNGGGATLDGAIVPFSYKAEVLRSTLAVGKVKRDDLVIVEVTFESLKEEHVHFLDLVVRFFLRRGESYPSIMSGSQ
jgi:hypothetical protein